MLLQPSPALWGAFETTKVILHMGVLSQEVCLKGRWHWVSGTVLHKLKKESGTVLTHEKIKAK